MPSGRDHLGGGEEDEHGQGDDDDGDGPELAAPGRPRPPPGWPRRSPASWPCPVSAASTPRMRSEAGDDAEDGGDQGDVQPGLLGAREARSSGTPLRRRRWVIACCSLSVSCAVLATRRRRRPASCGRSASDHRTRCVAPAGGRADEVAPAAGTGGTIPTRRDDGQGSARPADQPRAAGPVRTSDVDGSLGVGPGDQLVVGVQDGLPAVPVPRPCPRPPGGPRARSPGSGAGPGTRGGCRPVPSARTHSRLDVAAPGLAPGPT